MLAGLFPEEEGGRSGLSQIKVTPLVYLQLAQSLHNKQKVTHNKRPLFFNETQLKMAFSHYLRENKGSWTAEQARNMDKLHDLATKIVEKDVDKARQENEKDRKKGVAPEVANKKQAALLQKLGLVPEPKDELEFEQLPSESKADKALRDTLTAEEIVEALSMAGEPTATIALGLVIIAARSEFTDVVMKYMFDLYEDKADNVQKKNPITNVLQEKASSNVIHEKSETIDRLLIEETHAKPAENLHALKEPHDHAAEMRRLFEENKAATGRPVFAPATTTQKRKQTAFDLPTVPMAPKFDYAAEARKTDRHDH